MRVPNPKLLLHIHVSAQVWADAYTKTESTKRILKYTTDEFRVQFFLSTDLFHIIQYT
jgi:hypothetical protein